MWDNPRQLNIVSLALTALALTLLTWGGMAWIVRQPMFAIRAVRIDGSLIRTSPAHLQAIIREEIKGTFFTLRLADARASLLRVPWVRTIGLRREWPNALQITVGEHEPLARWNETALVDRQGEVFIADYNGELPQFNGPEGTADEMTVGLQQFGALLAPARLSIAELHLSPRGSWSIKTAGHTTLTIELGRTEPTDRLRRFLAYYGKTIAVLARAGTSVEYVDLRYRNGFAARLPGFKERPARKAA